jgi:16S rRNA (uracil1498-N3)-methyltransferase
MRNSVGNTLHVTDGQGRILTSTIQKIDKTQLKADIINERKFENKAINIWFCIPSLKNPDRLKFAFEKCVELGITNFIHFSSKYSINKKPKLEKYQKTTLSAMKQSLRAYLPNILASSLDEIANINGTKILLDQNANKLFDGKIDLSESVYFIFGPEGGFDESEINLFEKINTYSLSAHRLRTETAIVNCASVLNLP